MRPFATVQGSPQASSIDWAAELARHTRPAVPQLTAASSPQLQACRAQASTGEAPVWQLCVLLLGRGGPLAAARGSLEALHSGLSSGGADTGAQAVGGGSAEQRVAGSLLAQGKVQLAWVDCGRQRPLCRHLLLWTGSSQPFSRLCGSWWRHLAALLGRRQQQQLRPVLVAYRRQQVGGRAGHLSVAAYSGSLHDVQQLAAWVGAVSDANSQGHPLRPAPPLDMPLAGPACTLPALGPLLLRALHLASQAELLWQQAAEAASVALQQVDWRRAAQLAAVAGALLGLKWGLDVLSGSEGEGACCSVFPQPGMG